MKKLLTLSVGALLALPAVARDFTYTYEGNTVTYTVIDETAKTCMTKEGKIDGTVYDVVSIESGNKNIKGNLILPEHPKDGTEEYTLIAIGKASFYGNDVNPDFSNNFYDVKIPNSVTWIGNFAFAYSYLMGDYSGIVNIPSSVTYIGERAFFGCTGLQNIRIPSSVNEISIGTFENCIELQKVEIFGSGLTNIGDSAFLNCGAMHIGPESPLEFKFNIKLPESVKFIGKSAFEQSSLTEVAIPEKVDSVGKRAFFGCLAMQKIDFCGKELKYINDSTFSGCGGISILTGSGIPLEVNLPESITHICKSAFSKSALKEIVLPDNVETIGESAFAECELLQTVTIPKNIKSGKLGYYSWRYCPNIQDVYYMTTSVYPGPASATTNIFDEDVYKAATLHVAKGMVPAFMKVNPWKLFGNIVDVTTGISEVESDTDSTLLGEIYNLNGVKVGTDTNALAPGLYIVREGDSVKKISIK